MAAAHGLKKLIIAICVLLAIILLIGLAILIVVNLTPNQLGFGDKAILEGESMQSLGLGDTKLIDIAKAFKVIYSPDEQQIVKNRYDGTTEADNAKTQLANSDAISGGGVIDYSSLYTGKIIYGKEYYHIYDDKTLAFLFAKAVSSATESYPDLKAIKDMNATVKEFTVNSNSSGKSIRVVLEADISSFKSAIEEAISVVKSFVKIPSKVYIVSYLKITGVDGDGRLALSPASLKINDTDTTASEAILKMLSSEIGSGGESTVVINQRIAGAVGDMIFNLGKVGTATADENHVINGNSSIGISGVLPGSIGLISHVN